MRPHLLCRCRSRHRQLSESALTCLLLRSAHLQPPRLVKYAGYQPPLEQFSVAAGGEQFSNNTSFDRWFGNFRGS
ncbi:MAG: hypothetical protein U9P36_04825, partial [Thermodesulfobacteriota bacterium]|nr:hypothetical protein [Thermodesulfobacteriota bacterium]